jgi:hypothetical protein
MPGLSLKKLRRVLGGGKHGGGKHGGIAAVAAQGRHGSKRRGLFSSFAPLRRMGAAGVGVRSMLAGAFARALCTGRKH